MNGIHYLNLIYTTCTFHILIYLCPCVRAASNRVDRAFVENVGSLKDYLNDDINDSDSTCKGNRFAYRIRTIFRSETTTGWVFF